MIRQKPSLFLRRKQHEVCSVSHITRWAMVKMSTASERILFTQIIGD